jgi:transportin-3
LDKTFVSGDHNFRVLFYRVFMGLQEVHAVQLSLQEEEDVMCAVGRVLSTVTSSIDVNSALERLLKPTHAAMETLLETDSEGSLRLHSAAYAASLEAGIRAVHR